MPVFCLKSSVLSGTGVPAKKVCSGPVLRAFLGSVSLFLLFWALFDLFGPYPPNESATTGFSNSTAFPLGRWAKSRLELGCLARGGPAGAGPAAAVGAVGVVDAAAEAVAEEALVGERDAREIRREEVEDARGDGFRVCPGRINTETSADSPVTPPPRRAPPPRIFSCGGALEPRLLLCPGRPASRHAAPGSGPADGTLGLEGGGKIALPQLPGATCLTGTLPSS